MNEVNGTAIATNAVTDKDQKMVLAAATAIIMATPATAPDRGLHIHQAKHTPVTAETAASLARQASLGFKKAHSIVHTGRMAIIETAVERTASQVAPTAATAVPATGANV